MSINNQKPKISVVIPTCNRPKLLLQAVQSVLSQTFQDFEIIIIDDGLRERANRIIGKINDNRIVYIQNKENKGGSAARNIGIKNAQADWVAFLDDDDEWDPKKLQEQYEAIKKHGNKIGFVFCGAEFCNQQNNNKKIKKYDPGETIKNYYQECISLDFKTYTPMLVIKKDILEEVGYFDEDLPSNQETELMMRITKISNGYCVNDILIRINFFDGEHIGGNIDRRIKGKELVLRKHWDELKKMPKALARHYYVLGDLYRVKNDLGGAQKYYKKSWQSDKKQIKSFLLFVLLFSHFFYKIIMGIKKYKNSRV